MSRAECLLLRRSDTRHKLAAMFCVSVLLTSSEWIRIRDAAAKTFPGEVLSRGEVIRRYALSGIEALKNAAPADRERLVHGFQASMEASDERLRH